MSVKAKVRIGVVQWEQKALSSWDWFAEEMSRYAHTAGDYGCDFLLFPELFTLQLLSMESKMLDGPASIAKLTTYTEPLLKLCRRLAKELKINVILGSHPSRHDDGKIRNSAYVFLRSGGEHRQDKIHMTPSESKAWNIEGGEALAAIETDCGKIGVLICYDSEFPELARRVVDQGAQILFVPFCTDERQGYLRVRYSAQARAIENQVYVALAGNVGNLPKVYNMDIQYGQSAVLSPCDYGFGRDGIVAESDPGVAGLVFADLDMQQLQRAREDGTVKNLKDRRKDLYDVRWLK